MAAPSSNPLRALDLAPRRWDNGGGLTRDLVADAEPWRWRLSLADIDTDGPFSAMPGVQRWFAVVEGAGVELMLGGTATVVRPLDPPLVFDGAEAPQCRLLDGPVRALNLMLRGARGQLRRAGSGVIWSEEWPLRGHFAHEGLCLHWDLPHGPQAPRGEGCWIGIAP